MNGAGLIPRPLAWGLIALISLLWGADVVAAIVDDTHELNATLGTAFLVVAGLLGGLSKGRSGAAGADEPDPPEDPDPDDADPDEPTPDEPPLPPGVVSARELLARYSGEYPPPGRRR